jgi:hypothetical protein
MTASLGIPACDLQVQLVTYICTNVEDGAYKILGGFVVCNKSWITDASSVICTFVRVASTLVTYMHMYREDAAYM